MRAVFCLLTIALALGASPARAELGQEAPEDDEAAALAEVKIQEGVERRKEGREAEALELFRQAHALHPSPRAMGQMGLAAKSLRLYVEAEEHLTAALATDDPWVEKNRDALELAREVVGRQLGSLTVRANVEDAELWIDGDIVGRLPLDEPLRVRAGVVRIQVRARRHATAKAEATIAAGALTELQLTLSPLAAPPPPRASSSPQPESVNPEPAVSRPVTEPDLRPWIYASAAVGGAALVVGGVLGAVVIVKKSERDEICPTPICPTQEGVELDREARAAATGSTVAFVVGGAAVAAAVVLWVLEPGDATTASVAVGPAPGGGVTALLSWRL